MFEVFSEVALFALNTLLFNCIWPWLLF